MAEFWYVVSDPEVDPQRDVCTQTLAVQSPQRN